MTCETAHNWPTKLTSTHLSLQGPKSTGTEIKNHAGIKISRTRSEPRTQELDQKPRTQESMELRFYSHTGSRVMFPWTLSKTCFKNRRSPAASPSRYKDGSCSCGCGTETPWSQYSPMPLLILGREREGRQRKEGIGVEVKKRRRQLNWKDAGERGGEEPLASSRGQHIAC